MHKMRVISHNSAPFDSCTSNFDHHDLWLQRKSIDLLGKKMLNRTFCFACLDSREMYVCVNLFADSRVLVINVSYSVDECIYVLKWQLHFENAFTVLQKATEFCVSRTLFWKSTTLLKVVFVCDQKKLQQDFYKCKAVLSTVIQLPCPAV